MNYINLPDNSGHGVQLACSNCHEQWWEMKKESINANQQEIKLAIPDSPFRNLTDISLLYKKPSSKRSQHHHADLSTADARPFASPQASSQKPKKWKMLLLIAFWSSLIFGGTITLALIAMQFDNPLFDFSSDTKTTHSEETLTIENVHFDVKPVDEKRQKIIVVGQIKNSGQLAMPLHNLQLTSWGTCQQEQTPNEHGLCEIRTWSYKWKQELLQPGEELTFKSAAKIPTNLQVEQVHVDFAEN